MHVIGNLMFRMNERILPPGSRSLSERLLHVLRLCWRHTVCSTSFLRGVERAFCVHASGNKGRVTVALNAVSAPRSDAFD